jgi:hypothetical protein
MALLALVLLLGLAQNALALEITPADKFAQGEETSNGGAITEAEAACSCDLVGAYKQDVGGPESGPLATSYSTSFANSPSDPSEFTITYTGGPVVQPVRWLLVKDGNSDPAWYLFNLSTLGWNGTDVVHGTGFWPGKGAVSHVELFTTNQQVPEPTSLLLLGAGLLALSLLYRSRQ